LGNVSVDFDFRDEYLSFSRYFLISISLGVVHLLLKFHLIRGVFWAEFQIVASAVFRCSSFLYPVLHYF
jgi:hypothetical protein